MNKTLLSFLAVAMGSAPLSPDAIAARSVEMPSLLKVESIQVAHVDSTLIVSFDVDPQRVKPGSDRQVMFTPVVKSNVSNADSIMLEPVTFAGRNRYYSHLREGDIEAGALIYRAGKKGRVEYSRAVAWQPWMEQCSLIMREETQDCCKPVKPLCDTPLADINTVTENRTDGYEEIDYIALTGDSAVVLEAEGKAYIDFVVNRTEIKDNYRRNPQELKKIIESIDVIKNDPDATITRLTIKGFASPEGSYENNVRLAIGRTEALKEYVRRRYDFDPKIMLTNYEPEDWDGLRAWLETADIPNRDAIMQIVNSGLAPDPKDEAIKQKYPAQYRLLLDSVYPALRHSDYTVQYKIKTFVDIEELKLTYAKAPQRLRPVDFYRVAQTFPEGSPQFEAVLLKASEIYPYDQQAAINAANILIRNNDLDAASEKLNYAGESGEANYTRGILAAINGDLDRAEFFFSKALELGVEKAAPRLARLEQLKNPETIIYLIDVEK